MIEDIHRAAGILAPEGVVEVRALADGVTHSGYFDDYDALVRTVEALDADPSVAGIYVTLNSVNPALLARRANRIKMRLGRNDATTADADILRRRWFPVDIDPVRPSGVSSTDAEHEAALAAAERIAIWLAEQGFPAPIRADSGNGAHLLYRIDLPNDDSSTALVRGALVTLDALFSNETVTVDTANHNAARIWKLYGTCSRKGDSTPERPHRRAKLLAVPDELRIVPRESLQHLAGLLPREEPPQRKNGPGIDLAAWLAEHGIAVRSTRPWQGGTLFTLEDCPFSSAHKDGAFAVQFANGAVFAGCHHQTCGGGAQRWPELRGMYEQKRRKPEVRAEREQEEQTTSPPGEHHERALAILQNGDPLAFLLDTFNKSHVGDRTVAECLAMSLASQSVENTNGLHVAVSGNSGKGKTHACTTMQNLIPGAYKLKGTVSNKALYYDDDLRPGTVLLFDDVSLSDDLQEVLKSATANFREPIEHRTLTTERKLRVCTIPERCVWWLAKVEEIGDNQVMNRMLTAWIDDSVDQDRRVLDHMKEAEAAGQSHREDDVLTCRAIWEAVKAEALPVRIPFARRIQFSTTQNRRNPGMLFDLIKCRARLFSLQRDRDGGGAVIAREEDFAAAARLYGALNGEAGGQETKLTKNETAALATVESMGVEVFTIRLLQNALGLSYHQTRRLLHGYNNSRAAYAGLLEKCPAASTGSRSAGGSSTSRSTPRSTGPGAGGPPSGWTTTPVMETAIRMVALLHPLCTGIPGKVQTKRAAIVERILVLERDVQRYVPIRAVICTGCRERRACLQGRATRPLVSVKSAVVQTCQISQRTSGRSRIRPHPAVLPGAKLGATRVQRCKRPFRSTPPITSRSRWRRTNPAMPAAAGRHPPLNAAARRSTSATTASKRQNGQECNPSPGSSTTGRSSGRRSNSAGARSAGRRERSTARGRRRSARVVMPEWSGSGTGGRGYDEQPTGTVEV